MHDLLLPYRGSETSVLWESVKFDGSPNRTAHAIDLGTTESGRWLLIEAGTPVTRPHGGGYDHPCDAVALIPAEGLWTATWLVDWDPALYVDVARRLRVGHERIVTMDLDIDVVRHRTGEVEVLDLDEFEHHRREFGYPQDLVTAVGHATDELARALREHTTPFARTPNFPRRNRQMPGGDAPTADRHQVPSKHGLSAPGS